MINYFNKKLLWRGSATASLFMVTASVFIGSAFAGALTDHPRLSPTRDVIVTYRFRAGDDPQEAARMSEVKVSFAASGDRLRIDHQNHQIATLLDRPSQKVTIVNMTNKTYAQLMPLHGLRNPFLLDLNMHYKAGDRTRVSGYPCQNWAIESEEGKAQACVTDDGVILSEKGVDADGITGQLEAINVEYRDIPASAFQPPADFNKLEPKLRREKGSENPVPEMSVPHAKSAAEAPGAEIVPVNPEGNIPDTTQPHVANDSANDGSVSHADQPGLNK
ncbi:DUF4412 domain-containing protein [Aristophania vespae]|nr:DUF4412 domain-containing protein [Aristophania vespae]